MKFEEIKESKWYNFKWMGGQQLYKVVAKDEKQNCLVLESLRHRKILLSRERFKEIEVEEKDPSVQIIEARHTSDLQNT